jgi:hypothetical protein
MFSVRVWGTHKGNVTYSALLHDGGDILTIEDSLGSCGWVVILRDEVMRSPCGCHRMKELGVLVTRSLLIDG